MLVHFWMGHTLTPAEIGERSFLLSWAKVGIFLSKHHEYMWAVAVQQPWLSFFSLGQVIKAWDIGVATMKVGELCQLVCKPEYAYGSAGSPPKIPPNATLIFEVPVYAQFVLVSECIKYCVSWLLAWKIKMLNCVHSKGGAVWFSRRGHNRWWRWRDNSPYYHQRGGLFQTQRRSSCRR